MSMRIKHEDAHEYICWMTRSFAPHGYTCAGKECMAYEPEMKRESVLFDKKSDDVRPSPEDGWILITENTYTASYYRHVETGYGTCEALPSTYVDCAG